MQNIRAKAFTIGNRLFRWDKTPRIFFCHVPKCAGTSLVKTIRQTVYPLGVVPKFDIDLAASFVASTSLNVPMLDVRQNIMAYNLALGSKRFGSGHIPCKPRLVSQFSSDWAFVTVLREPIDRWISGFVYSSYKKTGWFENQLSIEDYLETDHAIKDGRVLLRYFSSAKEKDISTLTKDLIPEYADEAIENLSSFALVGTSNNLSAWRVQFDNLFNCKLTLGVANSSPNKAVGNWIRQDPDLVARIKELCLPDLNIYQKLIDKRVIAM